MRDDRERLLDILEAIERIERYAARGREAFEREELLQTWAVYHLQIIGEAARKISDAMRTAHPEVPWPQIIALRNVLVHQCFGVDKEEVWKRIERDLPPLKQKLEALLGDKP